MDIRAEIQTRVDEIEQIIKRYLPEEEGWQKTIMEAMNYSILAGTGYHFPQPCGLSA